MAEFMICLFLFCLLLGGVIFSVAMAVRLTAHVKELQNSFVSVLEDISYWSKEIDEACSTVEFAESRLAQHERMKHGDCCGERKGGCCDASV